MPPSMRVDLDDHSAQLPARELPVALVRQLITARLDEFEATGAGW